MTIKLSANSMNDIRVEANRKKAEKLRQDSKLNPHAKFIKRIEDTGWIDAVDPAPERDWTHTFAKTPTSKLISKSFIDKLPVDNALRTAYNNFTRVHDDNGNKFLRSSGNFATAVAIPSLLAGAALIPAANIAGMGYLAGWGINALTGGMLASGVAAGLKGTRHYLYAQDEKVRTDEFVTALKTHATNNLTDIHKYYNSVEDLKKTPMNESDILDSLVGLYSEANKYLKNKHNASLTDVYLSSDDKTHLQNYRRVDNNIFVSHELHKNMTSVPANLVDGLPPIDGIGGGNTGNVVRLKIKALQDIGVTINTDKLITEATPDGGTVNLDTLNTTLNTKYGSVLDNALLIYQGQKSMAAPIVEQVDKLLEIALIAYSKKMAQHASRNGIKDVPQLTSDLVGKILARIFLHMKISISDPKLSRILDALCDTKAFMVAADLNRSSADSTHAQKQKKIYKDADLSDMHGVHAKELDNVQASVVKNYNPPKSIQERLEAMQLAGKSKREAKNIVYGDLANAASRITGRDTYYTRPWLGFGEPVLQERKSGWKGKWLTPWPSFKTVDVKDVISGKTPR